MTAQVPKPRVPTGRLVVVMVAGTVCAIVLLVVVTRILRSLDRAEAAGGLEAVEQLDEIRKLKETEAQGE